MTVNPSVTQDLGFPPLLKPSFVVQSFLGARSKGRKSLLRIRPRATDFWGGTSRRPDFTCTASLSLQAVMTTATAAATAASCFSCFFNFATAIKKIQNTLRTSADPLVASKDLHRSASTFGMTAPFRALLQVLWIQWR